MLLPLLYLVIAQSKAAAVIPSWAGLDAKYNYTHLDPKDVGNEKTTVEANDIKITFTYQGEPGDVVHGVLVEPKTNKPVPIVVLCHGLGGDKEYLFKQVGAGLLAEGIGYAGIDVPGHGERQTAEDKKVMQSITLAFMSNKGDLLKAMLANDPSHKVLQFLNRALEGGVIDDRHLLDYLTSRKDVDYHHISVIGVSLGSITGAILGPVDSRVKNMALLVGGDPVLPFIDGIAPEYRDLAIATSCSLYAPHFSGPVRMINGNKDSIMPRAATDRLYNAFPDKNKSIGWYNSDHFLPPLAYEEAVKYIADEDKP